MTRQCRNHGKRAASAAVRLLRTAQVPLMAAGKIATTCSVCVFVTSVLLATDAVMPFSLGMLLELLFGELGPEPGALLHAESETQTRRDVKHKSQAAQKSNL